MHYRTHTKEIKEKELELTSSAVEQLDVLTNAINEILDLSLQAYKDYDIDIAYKVEPLEQVIDTLRDSIKKRHIIRLQNSECTIEHGFILSDILNNLERVADHFSNIAGCYIEMSKHNALDLHKYLKDYRDKEEHFDTLFNEFSKKYALE